LVWHASGKLDEFPDDRGLFGRVLNFDYVAQLAGWFNLAGVVISFVKSEDSIMGWDESSGSGVSEICLGEKEVRGAGRLK
jgi:hypothetical protein